MLKSILVMSCAVSALIAPAEVLAQPAKALPPSDTEESPIVVTAQRREEALQDVPIAITAVTARTLKENALTSTDQLSAITPGVGMYHSSSGAQPFIRGVGNTTSAPGNEAPVAIYVDGVYMPATSSALFKFNNISQIDIAKGPQGTLFGRNATGGVVNITTRTPQHEPSVDMDVGYATYKTISANFYGTTGLSNDLAMDLAVSYSDQQDGWGKNLFDGSDLYLDHSFGVRSKLLWEPSDTLKITLSGDFMKGRHDSGLTFSAYPETRVDKSLPTGGFYDTNSNIPYYLRNKGWGGSLRIEKDIDWAVITSISGYRETRDRGLENQAGIGTSNARYFILNTAQKSFTQEVNIQSARQSRISWIAGLFYFNDKSRYDPLGLLGATFGVGPEDGLLLYPVQDTQSYAAYAQATFPLIGDHTNLTLGARYTEDRRQVDVTAFRTSNSMADRTELPLPLDPDLRKANSGQPTWRIALDHKITPDVMVYASYNRGFKSGNFNLTSPTDPSTKPQTVDAYEVGLKSEFLDRAVTFNAAAYYYDFKDLQVRIVGANSVPIMTNAAAARYYGLDAQLLVRPSRGLQFNLDVAAVDAKYTKFGPTTYIGLNPDGSVGGGFIGDPTGNRMPVAEPITVTVGGRYAIPTSIGEFVLNASAAFHDDYYFDTQNAVRQPPRTMVNASLNWTSVNGRWGVRLWAQNLLDEKYAVIAGRQANIATVYSAAPPLTAGGSVSVHF